MSDKDDKAFTKEAEELLAYGKKRREAQPMEDAIAKLAAVIENGELIAETDPPAFLNMAAEEITNLRNELANLKTEYECDDCDGSGIFFINDVPQECICTGSQEGATNLTGVLSDLLSSAREISDLKDDVKEYQTIEADLSKRSDEMQHERDLNYDDMEKAQQVCGTLKGALGDCVSALDELLGDTDNLDSINIDGIDDNDPPAYLAMRKAVKILTDTGEKSETPE